MLSSAPSISARKNLIFLRISLSLLSMGHLAAVEPYKNKQRTNFKLRVRTRQRFFGVPDDPPPRPSRCADDAPPIGDAAHAQRRGLSAKTVREEPDSKGSRTADRSAERGDRVGEFVLNGGLRARDFESRHPDWLRGLSLINDLPPVITAGDPS